jgi:hypothetical protein
MRSSRQWEQEGTTTGDRIVRDASSILESRLRYYLRCLREDATDPSLTALERLALVRGRAARMREIERELDAMRKQAQ